MPLAAPEPRQAERGPGSRRLINSDTSNTALYQLNPERFENVLLPHCCDVGQRTGENTREKDDPVDVLDLEDLKHS